MDQDSAYAITHRLLTGYGELRNKDEDRIRDAAFYLAFELIPDDALVGLAELDGQDKPAIVALDGQQLYVLSVAPLNDDDDPATGRLRLIHIKPDMGKVELKAQYANNGRRPARQATWCFTFDEVALAFQTKRKSGGEITGEWELAVKLAEMLGRKIADPANS